MTKASEVKEPYAECQECHQLFERSPRGPAPKYCSGACRQRAYQYRRRLRAEALGQPTYGNEMTERRAIQRMIRKELADTVAEGLAETLLDEGLVETVRAELFGDEEFWTTIRNMVIGGVVHVLQEIIDVEPAGRDRAEELGRLAREGVGNAS